MSTIVSTSSCQYWARFVFLTDFLLKTGHLTLKTDVYSLGVVLLEILSGLRAVKRYPNGKLTELSRWARPYLNDRKDLHCVIDKRIVKNLDIEEAYEFATIILQCLTEDPRQRPTTTHVLNRLEQLEQNMNRWNHTFRNGNELRKPYQIVFMRRFSGDYVAAEMPKVTDS